MAGVLGACRVSTFAIHAGIRPLATNAFSEYRRRDYRTYDLSCRNMLLQFCAFPAVCASNALRDRVRHVVCD